MAVLVTRFHRMMHTLEIAIPGSRIPKSWPVIWEFKKLVKIVLFSHVK